MIRVAPLTVFVRLLLLVSVSAGALSAGSAQAAPTDPDAPAAPTFTIRYNEGRCQEEAELTQWTPEAQTAMAYVIDILDDLLLYDGEIVVDA